MTSEATEARFPLRWWHYRMNDHVGPGIYATLHWPRVCTNPEGHLYGHLSQACLRCRCEPIVEYERV